METALIVTLVVLNFFLCGYTTADTKDLPPNFKKCRRSDPNINMCLQNSINGLLPSLKNGVPRLNIPSIDPLAFDSISISQGGNSAINLKQDFKNIKLLHLSESNITKFNIDFKKWRLRTIAVTPVMEFLGDYTMNGRVLVLPIVGNGKSNITMIELKTTHDLYGELYERDGEKYLRFNEYKLKFDPKLVKINFSNLFNGEKGLADNMNKFLNENWVVVFDELKNGYEMAFAKVFKQVTNKLFSQVPVDKIFLLD